MQPSLALTKKAPNFAYVSNVLMNVSRVQMAFNCPLRVVR